MNSSKHTVCVVTGTRAEYGLLRSLLMKLRDTDRIELILVVTGTHLSDAHGNTQKEIIKDGFEDFVRIPIPLEDDSKEGMALSAGVTMVKFAEFFRSCKPDLMVVLGDRYEIFAAVAAAHLTGIPIAHLGGGDVTEGAVDDAIRHSITKMSSLHFPGCEDSARRIIQMGEHPDSVHNVGEPGIENCLNMELLSLEELQNILQFPNLKQNYAVVTFHPVTMEDNSASNQLYALIEAMDSLKDFSYMITMANADAGGRSVNAIWQAEAQRHSNWLLVPSLGVLPYLSAVKYAKMVVGNSSSGIYEAPALGTPTVNIGDRQKGRIMVESVICCDPEKDAIVRAMQKASSCEFQESATSGNLYFGDGTTSDQILKYVLRFLNSKADTSKKQFFNL